MYNESKLRTHSGPPLHNYNFLYPTWVNGTTNDSAEWIPGHIIKPVVKCIESFLNQIFGCSVVEVGIKLVDNTLISQHGKETSAERYKSK